MVDENLDTARPDKCARVMWWAVVVLWVSGFIILLAALGKHAVSL